MDILDFIEDYLNDNKEGIKNVITCFLNSVMLEEAARQSCTTPYERTDARKAHRNGFKTRSLKTQFGTLHLNKPQFREISFETKVFENYARVDQALKNTILESYIGGTSTRKVQTIVKRLGVEELSAESVSRIAKELDEKVEEFLKRPIEKEIRYLFVDATYVKVRENCRYISKALYIAIGVNVDGYREILGAKLADSENEAYWTLMFDELKNRGLSGVQLVISDGHNGIRKAVETSFLGASWQMCYVHYMRNVLKHIPQKYMTEVSDRMKSAMDFPEEIQKIADDLRDKGWKEAANTIERFLPDVLNYQAFPREHWKKIRTTNGIERINKEIKRRIRVVGAFPSASSFMRVAVSILIDINEDWLCGNRYLRMED